jgi:hypothetical protein
MVPLVTHIAFDTTRNEVFCYEATPTERCSPFLSPARVLCKFQELFPNEIHQLPPNISRTKLNKI